MNLTVRKSRISGSIAVPGSKSHTIRGIVAALIASGESRLLSPLVSADTMSVLNAARNLGLQATICSNQEWILTGSGGRLTPPGKTIDLGNSGTGLHFITSLASLADFPVTLDGDDSLRSRPLRGLLNALAELGIQSECSERGGAPVKIYGGLKGGCARVDGTTSQFVSSLLFALPFAPCNSTLSLDFLNEKPYVGITLDWLKRLNIQIQSSDDLLHFEIQGGQKLDGFERVIPADFSTAAFPLAAAILAGDGVEIRNLDFADVQGDKIVFEHLRKMGAVIEQGDECFIPHSAKLTGIDIDLNAAPDALPILAVVASTLKGQTTRILNVPQARLKETDRIKCMALELKKLQIDCEELSDGLIVHGDTWHGGVVDSHDDHRIAMSLAIGALTSSAPVTIRGAECAGVTYPDFVTDFQRMGADFQTSNG